jgi:hypothetical protein
VQLSPLTPEYELWLSVLVQAINDRSDRNAHIKSAAGGWLESDSSQIGSFKWVCDMLGFDPGAVRSLIHSAPSLFAFIDLHARTQQSRSHNLTWKVSA